MSWTQFLIMAIGMENMCASIRAEVNRARDDTDKIDSEYLIDEMEEEMIALDDANMTAEEIFSPLKDVFLSFGIDREEFINMMKVEERKVT